MRSRFLPSDRARHGAVPYGDRIDRVLLVPDRINRDHTGAGPDSCVEFERSCLKRCHAYTVRCDFLQIDCAHSAVHAVGPVSCIRPHLFQRIPVPGSLLHVISRTVRPAGSAGHIINAESAFASVKYCADLRNRGSIAAKIDAFQITAAIERIFVNTCHTAWNGDARQTTAVSKRILSNNRYAVWNCDVGVKRSFVRAVFR